MFKEIIENINGLYGCYKKGLQALGSNSRKIKPQNSRNCEGSVDIDSALKVLFPQENRWDYVVCYESDTYYIEIHPAVMSEINVIIKKINWLKNWLKNDAATLNKYNKSFHWVPSGKNAIQKDSRQARILSQNGIKVEKEIMHIG